MGFSHVGTIEGTFFQMWILLSNWVSLAKERENYKVLANAKTLAQEGDNYKLVTDRQAWEEGGWTVLSTVWKKLDTEEKSVKA